MVKIECDYIFDRPLIEIEIINGNNRLKTRGLLDSGADMTFIPKTVGEVLKLNNPSGDEVSDILGESVTLADGKKTKYVKRTVTLLIGAHKSKIKVGWLFMSNNAQILLGRDLFLDFDVLFKERKKKVILETDQEVFN